MTWYSLSIADSHRATAIEEQIQAAALKLPQVVTLPGFAIFVISDHGGQQWYFSPDAGPIAHMFGAVRCAKPDPNGWHRFSLSLGNADSWSTHFPGYQSR